MAQLRSFDTPAAYRVSLFMHVRYLLHLKPGMKTAVVSRLRTTIKDKRKRQAWKLMFSTLKTLMGPAMLSDAKELIDASFETLLFKNRQLVDWTSPASIERRCKCCYSYEAQIRYVKCGHVSVCSGCCLDECPECAGASDTQ